MILLAFGGLIYAASRDRTDIEASYGTVGTKLSDQPATPTPPKEQEDDRPDPVEPRLDPSLDAGDAADEADADHLAAEDDAGEETAALDTGHLIAEDDAGDLAVERHPVMSFDHDNVAAGELLTVEFWLSVDVRTPEVRITPGADTAVTGEGALAMSLPRATSWKLRTVLSAPGFELVEGKASQLLTLPAAGDSSPALFVLAPHADGPAERKVQVTLWHNGSYLGRIVRTVRIEQEAVETTARRREAAPAPISINTGTLVPDITVSVYYDDPGSLGSAQIIVASPHFSPPSRLVVGRFVKPDDLGLWLRERYGDIVDTTLRFAHARGLSLEAPPQPETKTISHAQMRGLGCDLWRNFAPPQVKHVFAVLGGDPSVELKTIQIFSNDPALPWEIMVPSEACGADGADFLGVDYALARWHISRGPNLADRPQQELALAEIAVVAPRYQGDQALPHQETELANLSRMAGYRAVPGRLADMADLFASGGHGVFHFAGHGDIQGSRGYRIRLEDATLDAATWRGLGAATKGDGRLFFFNACEVGRAGAVASFVEGWAPSVLEAGASGFIGALWPVVDLSAAEAADTFYAAVNDALTYHRPVPVAEALRAVRRKFHETGDPTFLAYAFYGDVNLRLVRPGK
ncbi:MAG: CHAT domain-containing protein [Alphaproteobacteria bacterium]|nr:CHAT domain-containing protein [Alphaproteobacteria bacterium]